MGHRGGVLVTTVSVNQFRTLILLERSLFGLRPQRLLSNNTVFFTNYLIHKLCSSIQLQRADLAFHWRGGGFKTWQRNISLERGSEKPSRGDFWFSKAFSCNLRLIGHCLSLSVKPVHNKISGGGGSNTSPAAIYSLGSAPDFYMYIVSSPVFRYFICLIYSANHAWNIAYMVIIILKKMGATMPP